MFNAILILIEEFDGEFIENVVAIDWSIIRSFNRDFVHLTETLYSFKDLDCLRSVPFTANYYVMIMYCIVL